VEALGVERGRYVLSGKCRYSLIVLLPDGEMTAKEIDLPRRYVLEGAAAAESPLYEASANVISARVRTDGNQQIGIDAEVGLGVRVWSEQEMSVVCALQVGEPITREAGEMVLCYPNREDTLWSVGKRYHRPIDALVQSNQLSDEKRADDKRSLSDVRVIAI
jgi:hypothetical protein